MDLQKPQSRRVFLGVAGGGLASSLLPGIAKADVPGVKLLESQLASLLVEPVSLENLHARITTRLRKDRSAVAHAQAWAKAYPQAARSLLQTAETDVQGRFILPGSGNEVADVGNPPRWRENALKDAESVWFLNRLKHWPRMLRAGAITGDPRFAEKVIAEMDDWMAKCPCPPIDGDLTLRQNAFSAVTPWRALEVGIRMIESWPQTLRLLAESPLLTPERLARYVISAHQHGRVLAEISPLLWPAANHNHYLMENGGLLAVACLLPELRSAEDWKRHAWHELNRCLDAQLTRDGGQIEGSPHYHNVSVRNFCEVTQLAAREKLPGWETFRGRVECALNYTAHSFRPSGTTVPWADGDATPNGLEIALWGGLVLNRWNVLGALRAFVPTDVFEETASVVAWRVDDLALWLEQLRQPHDARLPLVHWDRDLDQTMMRSDWTPQALSLFFGCHTPVTPKGNGHAHIDPASFDFTAFGRPLLVDPGRYTYREGEDRRHFKSAKWHNSLTIDDREPFEYLSSWEFGPQREGRIVKMYESAGLRGAEALNRNFEPVVHRRAVALLENRALLVLDEVAGLAERSSVQIWFHLDSNLVTWDEAASTACSADEGRANVRIITTAGVRGELLAGRVSDALDISRPSLRLKLSANPAKKRIAFATLIVPFGNESSDVQAAPFPLEVTQADEAWKVRLPLGNKVSLVTWQPAESLILTVG